MPWWTHGSRASLAVALLVFSAGCHRPARDGAPGAGDAAHADSLEGIVRLVGVEAASQMTLAPDDGSAAVTLVGPASLRAVTGLDIAIVGARAGRQFTVSRFTVVSANGVPATDGMLAADGQGVALVTADGKRHALVSPSPALRAALGHRVWVSGPLNAPPVAYGIVE